MVRVAQVSHDIELPDGVSASIDGDKVTLSKDGDSLSRTFAHNRVSVKQSDGALQVFCSLPRRSEKAIAGGAGLEDVVNVPARTDLMRGRFEQGYNERIGELIGEMSKQIAGTMEDN